MFQKSKNEKEIKDKTPNKKYQHKFERHYVHISFGIHNCEKGKVAHISNNI